MKLTRIPIGIALVAVLAVVAFGWLVGVAPRLTETARLDGERTGVEAQNTVQQAALTALAADFDRRDEVLADLGTARELVPSSPETASFLFELTTAAAEAGVTLGNFTPSAAVAYTGAVVDATAAPATDATTGAAAAPAPATVTNSTAVIPDASGLGLYYVPVTVTVAGAPDQIMRFVGIVQEGPRLFISPSVTISGAEGGAPTGTLTGFLFALPDAVPAATPAAPAAAPAAG